jgi:hypothetical protein
VEIRPHCYGCAESIKKCWKENGAGTIKEFEDFCSGLRFIAFRYAHLHK